MDPALDRGPQPAADPEPIAALPPSAGTSITAALAPVQRHYSWHVNCTPRW